MPSTALKSLYGGKKALAGNVGGQKREQTVLTPKWLIDGLLRCCGLKLGLDPCTTSANPTGAAIFCSKTEKLKDGVTPNPFDDGLKIDWADTTGSEHLTFVNPPYADLEEWLKKCAEEARNGARIYALIPFRPQRTWFSYYLHGQKLACLAPFPFVGEKNGFPAPLCIASWNVPVPTEMWQPRARGNVTNLITSYLTVQHEEP